jgi:hypothetical protein
MGIIKETKHNKYQAGWHTPVIPALRRLWLRLKLRQENHKFKASLGYTVRSCSKKKFC